MVTQQDHAAFAAELLRLWRGDGLPLQPRRRALLAATREHDNGWRESDAAPLVDPASGRPRDFLTLPRGERHELWERGSARHVAADPEVALLVTEHALQLLAEPAPDAERAALLARLAERRDDLLAGTGVAAAELAELYSWLRLADTLSLLVLARWDAPAEHARGRAWQAGDTLHLVPFPLAGATTFAVACRHVPDRRYGGDADLAVALASARWEALTVRVAPGEA